MINVPFRRQEKDHTCALAAIRMVLEFYGMELTEAEVGEFMNTNEQTGTEDHDELAVVARHHGLSPYINQHTTSEEIKKFITRGIPVVVSYMEPEEDEGHFAVVTDINDKFIFLNDPWFGPNFSLPLHEFTKRWQSKYTPHKQWLLAVAKDKQLT